MSQQYTPLPWNNDSPHGAVNITDSNGRLICSTGGYSDNFTPNVHETNEANAAFIVRACNAHEELLKAAEDVSKFFVFIESNLQPEQGLGCKQSFVLLRNAIAKARGEDSQKRSDHFHVMKLEAQPCI